MPAFDVAYVREQGQSMVIVPLDGQFEHKSEATQRKVAAELQVRAAAAGLAGKVVLMWRAGSRTRFIAPPQWHAFFRSIDLSWVAMNINKRLSW
ncbi:hypothetical protein [Phenylobacterium sp.]|uniref:hypothetical protein n=1 Tax=Phenylobacterium sp. TaxID=1871053 RepID=UPI00356876E6